MVRENQFYFVFHLKKFEMKKIYLSFKYNQIKRQDVSFISQCQEIEGCADEKNTHICSVDFDDNKENNRCILYSR